MVAALDMIVINNTYMDCNNLPFDLSHLCAVLFPIYIPPQRSPINIFRHILPLLYIILLGFSLRHITML